MEAYSEFAKVYDLFMDNIPYDEWAGQIRQILSRYGVDKGLILDLGCGTGRMTRLLASFGYDMIGVDSSEEMLAEAREADMSDPDILYLCQDMRSFELYGTVRAIVSICDCMNYILEEEDMLDVFRLVNNYLDPGGIFLFDLNTPYKYEQILGNQTIGEAREDHCFIWDNYYDKESGINEYALNLFIQGEDGRYDRYEEFHYQKSWDVEKIRILAEKAGLGWKGCFEAFTGGDMQADSERVCIILQEQQKERL